MIMRLGNRLFPSVVFAGLATTASAVQLVLYPIPTGSPGNVQPNPVAANMTASNLSVGAGSAAVSTSSRTGFLFADDDATTEAGAVANNDYWEFTIDAAPGFVLDLDEITFPFGGTSQTGGFDTNFTRAQDLEFNVRLRRKGGRVICDPNVAITYYSRPTYKNLAGMSYQYGYWKVLVNAKHKLLSSVRQLFPAVLFSSLCAGFLAMPFLGSLWWLGFGPLALYLSSAILMSAASSIRRRQPRIAPRVMIAFVTAHLVYGFGYLRALFNTYVLRKHRWTDVSRVTR